MSLTSEDRQWIVDLLEANMTRLKSEIRAESREDLEGMETRLLTAFQKWASPVEIRQRGQSGILPLSWT